MKMHSRYLNRDIELPETNIQSNGEAITIVPHDALEDLIYNSQEASDNNIQVHYTPVVVEPRHYAFMCAINDKFGRRIESIGESLDATLENEISRNYPALMAVKRAFDDAAIKFLGLDGKVYSDQQMPSKVQTPAASEDISMEDTAEPVNEAPKAATASAEPVSDEPDEFDTTIVDAGNVRRQNYSVRECYRKSPHTVRWVANSMLAQSEARKHLKDVCIRFLERVDNGLEERSPDDNGN